MDQNIQSSHNSANSSSINTDMDQNIQSSHNSANSSSINWDDLVDGRNIRNLLYDKTFIISDSKPQRINCNYSYSIYFAIENNILEVDIDTFNLNEKESVFSFFYTSSYLQDGSDSIYYVKLKSNWDYKMDRYIKTYLKYQFWNASYLDLEYYSTAEPYKHLWVQCESEDCYALNYKDFFKSKMYICEQCGYHLKMSSLDRIDVLIDPGTWNPMDQSMESVDPIQWDSDPVEWDPLPNPIQFKWDWEEDPTLWEETYKKRIFSYKQRLGFKEAVQTGTGQLNGIPLAIGIMEFKFMGGSMGSVVGEKITRLIEYATNQRLPLILVCASAGARMHEGSLSLMQMAKISSALYTYQINQKLFYVPILTSPTTGGVTASFGMLGDIIIAEPNAYIAFAGKRVIEQTLNKEVPEGSQSAEVLFAKGLADSIVPRNLLKEVLTELFQFHGFVPLTQNKKDKIKELIK